MQIFLLLAVFLTGAGLTYFFYKSRSAAKTEEYRNKFNETDKQLSIAQDRLLQYDERIKKLEETLIQEREQFINVSALYAEQKVIATNFQEKLFSQKAELDEIQKKFTVEFENLSSRILDEKSLKFTEQNRINLDIILNPLKEKIKDFEQKVEQSYKLDAAERNTLKGEIKNLIELNKQISEEANNLARALKGDTKRQGNWGEVILERILERSGLTKGSEYDIQVSINNNEGKSIRPDVIVYLPEGKHIIIDAKVSLIAYEALVNCEGDEDREKCLRDHILSVRNHIRGLSEKSYESSEGLITPDFVLLFMPIEPSFGIAMQADSELFSYAWDKKIVIVSPSTLLATLKTVSAIWKQEKQTRNALEIARQGGALYDKFVNFYKDLSESGEKLRSALRFHDEAIKKLESGPGNLIRSADKLKKLGVKSNKELPVIIVEKAEESNDSEIF
jgi:DNA recombination protein RmuC